MTPQETKKTEKTANHAEDQKETPKTLSGRDDVSLITPTSITITTAITEDTTNTTGLVMQPLDQLTLNSLPKTYDFPIFN
jgi:hypothetical protein